MDSSYWSRRTRFKSKVDLEYFTVASELPEDVSQGVYVFTQNNNYLILSNCEP